MTDRPAFVTEAHLTFLDELRDSGETNMYGARPYVMREFPELTKDEALAVCMYWSRTFGERHGLKRDTGHIATDLAVVFACLALGFFWLWALP